MASSWWHGALWQISAGQCFGSNISNSINTCTVSRCKRIIHCECCHDCAKGNILCFLFNIILTIMPLLSYSYWYVCIVLILTSLWALWVYLKFDSDWRVDICWSEYKIIFLFLIVISQYIRIIQWQEPWD